MVNERIDKYQFEEGYCQAEKSSSDKNKDNFTFCYYDQDHLGNIRQVREADGSKKVEVIQSMNYYPFGAEFCDNGAKNNTQKHKYNGKEFDNMHGLNSYDYGARQYNPVTARWDRVDPLAEKYYGVSPYVYCRNNPIMLIDPEGLTDYTVNENGQMYESTSLWEKIKRLFGLGCGADQIFDESTGGLLVSCEEGSIKNLKTEEVTSKECKKSKHTSFEYSGEKSEDIFQGIINKSKVEWAEIDYKNDGQDNHIFITDHAIDDVSSSANILNTLESQKSTTSFYMKHSHPVSDYDLRSNMSGFINLDPSGPDKKTAQKHPNVIFSVYNMYNHKIQYYNEKGIYKQKGV